MKNKLRIGLLINSYIVDAWIYELINQIREADFADITLVVLNSPKKKKSPARSFCKNKDNFLYYLYQRFDNIIFNPTPNAFEKKDTSKILKKVPILNVQPIEKDFSDYFSDKDIKRIREYNIDVFIKFGFRTLIENILSVSKYGIWSYPYRDDGIISGGPSGFWEVFKNIPVTGSILQIISEDLDNSINLYRSFSSTNRLSVTYNRNNYYWKSLFFIPRKLEELYLLGKKEFFKKISSQENSINIYFNKLYKSPNNLEFLYLLNRNIFFNVREILKRKIYHNQWFLLYHFNGSFTDLLFKYKTIKPPKDRSWADPCPIYYNDKFFIFIEEYINKVGKGHISVFEIDQNGIYSMPIKIIEKDYHLSYPYIFKYKNDYYMIPESWENKCIELYKCQIFPYKWTKVKTLISNVHAVDPTIYYFNNIWWLFTNICTISGASPNDELFLFFTDNPLNGDWIPHPLNPIISDVRTARPAGKIFEQNGKLYRPSQNCSTRYGYSINLNEIIELNEKSYHEKIDASLEPKWNKKIYGIHTFNKTKNLTIIDCVTKKFNLPF